MQDAVTFVSAGLDKGQSLHDISAEMLDACLANDPKDACGLGCDNMTVILVLLQGGAAAGASGSVSGASGAAPSKAGGSPAAGLGGSSPTGAGGSEGAAGSPTAAAQSAEGGSGAAADGVGGGEDAQDSEMSTS